MNRKLISLGILTAVIALPATAAAMPLPTPDAPPAGVTVTASVDCSVFNIAIAGLQPNTRVMVEMGSEPTYGFDYQGEHPDTFQFTVVGDTATASLPIGVAEQGTEFMTAIGLIDIATGSAVWPFYQWVDCTVAVADPPVVSDEPVERVADPVVVADDVAVTYFAAVELAPPW